MSENAGLRRDRARNNEKSKIERTRRDVGKFKPKRNIRTSQNNFFDSGGRRQKSNTIELFPEAERRTNNKTETEKG